MVVSPCFNDTHDTNVLTHLSIMNHPVHPNDSSDGSIPDLGKFVKLWFIVAVIGLFVFACFYTLKVAVDLFLPILLAGFLGFLLTPVTRWLHSHPTGRQNGSRDAELKRVCGWLSVKLV